jgi:hypothetical protein
MQGRRTVGLLRVHVRFLLQQCGDSGFVLFGFGIRKWRAGCGC